MARPTAPQDLVIVNHWWMEIPGLPGMRFETIDGLAVNSGTVSTVDASENVMHKFSNQTVEYPELTLTRPMQADANDIILEQLADECIMNFITLPPIQIVKFHKKKPLMSYLLTNFRFVTKADPTLDINSGEKFIQTYTATCLHEKLFVGIPFVQPASGLVR